MIEAMAARETTYGVASSLTATPLAEQQLIRELRAGSSEAFEYLVALYQAPLYRLACRILPDPADAADAVQETFIKVFRGATRFEGRSSLKTWMFRILVHQAANQRRWWRRHKEKESPLEAETAPGGLQFPTPQASPLELAMRAEDQHRIDQWMAAMPEAFRAVVVLRDLENLDYEEIAAVTGMPLGTVKSRLARGREWLRSRLHSGPGLPAAYLPLPGKETTP